ncbi:hypothetical protein COLO4_23681 [Corchorus olitorius]|uniref:Uncharacterized protein n=1 Tax=Corchorus olitorius TaxID=93759 RepID=A0A1R3IFB9_9ROSI|nr:hypothetical protein COLO4_23681 [Corchorus olitorius]
MLLMSMKPEIIKRYLRLSMAREIWSALSKAFYDGGDELRVFTLNQKELDHRDKVVMKDPDDVIAYQKSVERLRVHIFLAGLDGMFEQIRGEILRKEPVPDQEDFYAQIRRQASHQAALREDKEIYEATTMVSRNKSKPTSDATKRFTHCNQAGHLKDGCFELIGSKC